jgi:hypothetical protein
MVAVPKDQTDRGPASAGVLEAASRLKRQFWCRRRRSGCGACKLPDVQLAPRATSDRSVCDAERARL